VPASQQPELELLYYNYTAPQHALRRAACCMLLYAETAGGYLLSKSAVPVQNTGGSEPNLISKPLC
jgi:hypothetical protein